MRHGGRILVEALEAQGVDTVYSVPGESYLAVLDGLYESGIRNIVCRQEGGAAMMADAHARMIGGTGVCFVTRGPGATNASIGIHIAQQDSVPLVMFVGLPGRDVEDREAFQEFDLRAVFGSLAKAAEVVADTARLPEYVSRAFHRARSGRPGPVVLGLPEDVLAGHSDVPVVPKAAIAVAAPSGADMARLGELIARAERPLVVLGGPGWSAEAKAALEAAATSLDLPVGVAFRCQDYFDNRHPAYAGHIGISVDPALARRVRDADLLIAIGARLGEMTTSDYSLVVPPVPRQTLVHVHPDGDELGRVYRASLPICASSGAFVEALAAMADGIGPSAARAAWRQAVHADYEAFLEPEPSPGPVRMEEIMAVIGEVLPADTVFCNGAGNYSSWLHRYHRFSAWRSQLAPTCGAMGFGVPAAVAAKIAAPGRTVVAFAGDGCFMMNGQELATASQYDANIVVILVNNGMYGTIRMHQEKHFPGRVSGTALKNPDFAALAVSHGCHGETVEATAEFRGALERSLAAGRPALIEIRIDPEAITPKTTLAKIRAAALKEAGR